MPFVDLEVSDPFGDRPKVDPFDAAMLIRYTLALHELAKEGDERAQRVMEMFKASPIPGEPTVDRVAWMKNIHDNTWGTNEGLGAALKARVIYNDIKRRIEP